MGSLESFLQESRRRNLAILAGTALVMVLLAALALWREADEMAPRVMAEPFFPGLAHDAITEIRIRSRKGTLDIVFKPAKKWVVASHDDYPASFEQVRATIIGMAELKTLQPKTARADWLPYLGLVAPSRGGSSTEIALLDDRGKVQADLIAGKTTDIGDPNGATGLFVRRPDETQSYLARSVFEPKSDPADWLDKPAIAIDRARIAETDVDPFAGPSYVVRRDKPGDADFTLVSLPKGRALAYDGAPDAVAAALAGFAFDDVRPAGNFDFSDPAHTARLVTKTFDGLVVTATIKQSGSEYWATLSADGTSPDARKEAREIGARVSGWAYKLPAGQPFTTPLESLLKPAGTPAKPG
jgi:hypothetical protein